MSILLALALMGTTAAFAADLPSTCGDAGDELCVDADKDGSYANAKEGKDQDCEDDASTNWFAAHIFPGAPVALGDLADTNCDGSDDAKELEEALTAAGGADSPKGKALQGTINLCVDDVHEASDGEFVWSSAKGGDCKFAPGYERWDFDRASGVIPRAVVVEASRRRAGDAALREQLGTPGTPAVPKTDTTPEVPAVPATGFYLELAELEAAMAKADGETKAELAAAKAALEKRIGEAEASIVAVKGRVSALERSDSVQNDRLDVVETTGLILEGGVSGFVLAGRGLYEYKDGPMVRSGTGAGALGQVTIGQAWFGHVLYLDLGFGQGSEASGNASLPVTLGSAAFGHQWVVGDGSLAVGPQLLLVGAALGNPLDSTVSGWGAGGGVKLSYVLPLASPNVRVGIHCGVNGVAESFGTNDVWDTGAAFYGTCGLAGGYGPLR